MPTTSEPYSVCLASRNRLEQFRVTFPTILAQRPADVVLVDDGSTDGTEAWAAPCRQQLEAIGSEFYYHNTGQQGYRKESHGPPWNDAAVLAKHDLIVMQCPEVACFGNVYELLLEHVDENTIALARCYSVPLGFELPEMDRQEELAGTDALVEGHYGDPGLAHAPSGMAVYCGHERPVPLIFCGAMRAALWTWMGGYSETVRAAADTEFAQRALASGVKFYIVGDAVTFHQAHGRT